VSPEPPEVIVVAEGFGTLYEWPALGWLLPAGFIALIALLLVLRRRFPGLTPILIGVAFVPIAFVLLLLMGQAALVVAD
jgi:hypothetical protein